MRTTLPSLIGGIILSSGIAGAGYFVSQTMLNERTGANTARVKGLSTKTVPADTAHWNLDHSTSSRDFANVKASFDQALQQRNRIKDVLLSTGFDETELRFAPLQKRDHRRENREGQVIDEFYTVGGMIHITTKSPEKVEPAQAQIFALATEGISITQAFVDYNFTKLNEIKPDMLREATENARIAANEFAQNAGVTVGGIQSATQGGFQINTAGTDPLEKEVRVVTNITFYLDN